MRVVEGDWGGSRLADVEAVARSVTSCFDVFDADESVAIAIEPTPSSSDPPIALVTPHPSGELVVRLNVRGNLWARLAYQFAHEYCHVIADPTTWRPGRFAWVEEALCETASLFALRAMAVSWRDAAPYPNWQSYTSELDRYAAEALSDQTGRFRAACPSATGWPSGFRFSRRIRRAATTTPWSLRSCCRSSRPIRRAGGLYVRSMRLRPRRPRSPLPG